MYEYADHDVDDIYYQGDGNKGAPGLLDGHAVLFAEFIVDGGGDPAQDDDLPAGKSSDGDLQDRQATVQEEGQAGLWRFSVYSPLSLPVTEHVSRVLLVLSLLGLLPL